MMPTARKGMLTACSGTQQCPTVGCVYILKMLAEHCSALPLLQILHPTDRPLMMHRS